MTESTVRGAGVDLAVTGRGDPSRPTVVLIHGFPDTSAVWNPLAERLAGDFHVVTYDVRGAGRSGAPKARADYALPLLVDDLAAVVEAVSPDAPVHLVAHDWGSIQGWEAVVTARLAGTFASYTSISGPPLDHAALWARRHRSLRPADMLTALRQAVHSWYIAFFQLPVLPELFARTGANPRLWARTLHRLEGAASDATWPAATLPGDFAHGVQLYRANVGPRFRHPVAGHTDTPVQIIVPTKDRFVTAALLEGLDSWSSTAWRREIDAGHWVIRTHPEEIAAWVTEVITFVSSGVETAGLTQGRVAS